MPMHQCLDERFRDHTAGAGIHLHGFRRDTLCVDDVMLIKKQLIIIRKVPRLFNNGRTVDEMACLDHHFGAPRANVVMAVIVKRR